MLFSGIFNFTVGILIYTDESEFKCGLNIFLRRIWLYTIGITFEKLWQWLDSNFIPMDSKKFGFQNFDYINKFAMKNESEIEKLRSRDQRIFEKNRYYALKFKFCKIDFSQKSADHVTPICWFLTQFSLRIWWYNRNSEIQTFKNPWEFSFQNF